MVSIGGKRVRVVLSNEFGPWPLKVGAAHIALSDKGSAIVAGSGKPLTFGGRPSIVIPPGAPAISDPVDLAVPPLGSVAVSFFVPEWRRPPRCTRTRSRPPISSPATRPPRSTVKDAVTTLSRIFLTEILVDAAEGARAIVTFGDSITDGDRSSADTNQRWPDVLAERLQAAGGTPTAVLNQGISGERVLTDRMGVNALAHFDRAVLTHPYVDTVIFMMGINDIGWPDLRPRSACSRAHCRRDHRRLRAAHRARA